MAGLVRGKGLCWQVAAMVAAVGVLVFGTLAAGTGTASAAVSASLGVGCSASSSNGVADVKLRLTVRANGNGGDIDSVVLTSDDGSGPATVYSKADGDVGTSLNEQVVLDVPDVTDSYTLELTVIGEDASTATRTALATVTVSGSRVSCRVQTPAP